MGLLLRILIAADPRRLKRPLMSDTYLYDVSSALSITDDDGIHMWNIFMIGEIKFLSTMGTQA